MTSTPHDTRQVDGRRAAVRRDEAIFQSQREARMAYADVQLERPEALLTKDATADEFYRIALIYSEGMDVAVDLPRPRRHGDVRAAVIEGRILDRLLRREGSDYLGPA